MIMMEVVYDEDGRGMYSVDEEFMGGFLTIISIWSALKVFFSSLFFLFIFYPFFRSEIEIVWYIHDSAITCTIWTLLPR